MMKKVFFLSICVPALSFLVLDCKDKYSEANKINLEYARLVQDYINSLEQAADSADVARAINLLADGQEELWPRMQKLSETYPELKNRSDPPPAMKDSLEEVEEMGKKMMGT